MDGLDGMQDGYSKRQYCMKRGEQQPKPWFRANLYSRQMR